MHVQVLIFPKNICDRFDGITFSKMGESENFWNVQFNNSSKSYTIVILMHLAFAGSLFGSQLWATLIFVSFLSGLVYNYESTAVSFNFPNKCHGCIFAVVELVTSLFAFVQIPIIEQVRDTINFISISTITLTEINCDSDVRDLKLVSTYGDW